MSTEHTPSAEATRGAFAGKPIDVALFLPIHYGQRLTGEGIWRVIKELIVANSQKTENALRLTIVTAQWAEAELREELKDALGDDYASIVRIHAPPVNLAIAKSLWKGHVRARQRLSRRQLRRRLAAERKVELRSAAAKLFSGKISSYFAAPLLPLLTAAFALKYWWQDREKKESRLTRLIRSRATSITLESEFHLIATRYERRYKPDVWWVPFPIAMGITCLERPRVAHVYDFVFADFPRGQNLPEVAMSRLDIKTSLQTAAQVVTHSQHVRRRVVEPLFNVPSDRIHVIPHASPNLRRFVTREDGTMLPRSELAERIRAHCARKLNDWPTVDPFIEETVAPRLLHVPFENISYVLMSTQNRAYKNVVTVAKAVRVLNQHYGRRVFLALTGEFRPCDRHDPLARYVINQNMLEWVLPLPRVPDRILASLYACAAVAVHPSLYEGGVGAFPFYEALSVDCPALLSLNDSMREALVQEPGYSACLFNPFDVGDLIRKLIVVLDDRDNALETQRKIHENVSRRTWQDLIDDYAVVLRRAAALDER